MCMMRDERRRHKDCTFLKRLRFHVDIDAYFLVYIIGKISGKLRLNVSHTSQSIASKFGLTQGNLEGYPRVYKKLTSLTIFQKEA